MSRVPLLAATILSLAAAAGAARADAVAKRAHALRTAWLASGRAVPASGEPYIVSGKVLTPAVNVQVAPGQATVSLVIAPGAVGVDDLQVGIVSPSGQHSVGTFFTQVPSYPVKAKFALPVRIVEPFGGAGLTLYSEPGAWTVNSLSITSEDGNTISYTAAEIATLFGNDTTIQVTNNASPDTTPPTYGKGKILTPTVSLSAAPVFAVTVKVADAISGVQSVSLDIDPPGSTFPSVFASSVLDAPVQKGDVIAYTNLGASDPIGTYTIASFSVCDYAGNCVTDSTAAGIQKTFGATTFQVND
jgi:hypothetical protein